MKILLLSIGTRGDVEPFLAMGQILKEGGHQIIAAFPEQFRGISEEAGMEFASLGRDYLDSIESDLGRAAMGARGSGWTKLLANIRLARHQLAINRDLVETQHKIVEREQPDRILHNANATYPAIWGLANPDRNLLVCSFPYMHYVKGHAHAAFHANYGRFINRLTYALANFGQITTVWISARWLGLAGAVSVRQLTRSQASNMAIYAVSPTLFPRPEYWPSNLQVLGFHERKIASNWTPGADLKAFLASHADDHVLFVSFGSMASPQPMAKTVAIIRILERNRIPTIIGSGMGGLPRPDAYDRDLIFFVDEIPYEWVFQRVYAVIHHGGSGTTHMALKHGCASMAIPHVADQFVWEKIIQDAGAGPPGLRIDKLKPKELEPKVLSLLRNPAYKQRAEELGEQMRREDFREELYRAIISEG